MSFRNQGFRRVCVLMTLSGMLGCTTLPPASTSGPVAGKKTAIAPIEFKYRQDVALFALSLIGTEYRYGGDSPDSGLDCSGLVSYVFQRTTSIRLPHNASRIAMLARDIPASQLEIGDFVFFNTRGANYTHMGIYLGKGQFLHAPSTGSKVRIDNLSSPYYASRLNAAKTLFASL